MRHTEIETIIREFSNVLAQETAFSPKHRLITRLVADKNNFETGFTVCYLSVLLWSYILNCEHCFGFTKVTKHNLGSGQYTFSEYTIALRTLYIK